LPARPRRIVLASGQKAVLHLGPEPAPTRPQHPASQLRCCRIPLPATQHSPATLQPPLSSQERTAASTARREKSRALPSWPWYASVSDWDESSWSSVPEIGRASCRERV